MKKKYNKKIWAGVFLITMISSVIATTIAVNADREISGRIIGGTHQTPVPPPRGPSCDVLWYRTWSNGVATDEIQGESGRITVDNNNNIYVVGSDNTDAASILKYDPNGNLQWAKHPTSYPDPEDLAVLAGFNENKGENPNLPPVEIRRQILNRTISSELWDVAYSSIDNTIVSCGWATVDDIPIIFVVKYDANTGIQLWCRAYKFLHNQSDFPGFPMLGAIVVDSNGDIYTSGVVIGPQPDWIPMYQYGLVMKIGQDGIITHWIKIDNTLPGFTAYTGIDIASDGGLYVSGHSSGAPPLFPTLLYVSKRLKLTGDILPNYNYSRINTIWSYHMTIDKTDNNNIYAIGDYDSPFTDAGIVKLTSSLGFVYEQCTYNDWFQDVAVKDSQTLIIATKVERRPPQTYLTLRPNGDNVKGLLRYPDALEHYTAVDDVVQNGTSDVVYKPGSCDWANDTFELQDHTTEHTLIDKIEVYACVDSSGPIMDCCYNSFKLLVKNTSVAYSDEFVRSGYVPYQWNLTENPWTGQPWTWKDIDNLKIGIAIFGDDPLYRSCTQLYCVVTYKEMDQYTIALHNKADGHQIAKFCIGDVHEYIGLHFCNLVPTASGIVIDSNGNVIASGGKTAIDTMKCIVTNGNGGIHGTVD